MNGMPRLSHRSESEWASRPAWKPARLSERTSDSELRRSSFTLSKLIDDACSGRSVGHAEYSEAVWPDEASGSGHVSELALHVPMLDQDLLVSLIPNLLSSFQTKDEQRRANRVHLVVVSQGADRAED
jgi:hypothetical protein